ncbi:unnamed protein product [Blepharisma stoltei]|uniref:Ribosomal protein S10 n=1 Tax=Blepharisma stoltei TaxID=1481888 RepID=A0AAU9JXG5_9CILI|nr:unnamed protein product [Blepharisma stoltei]
MSQGQNPIKAYIYTARTNPDLLPQNFFYQLKKQQPYALKRNRTLKIDYLNKSSLGPKPVGQKFLRSAKNVKFSPLLTYRSLSLDASILNSSEILTDRSLKTTKASHIRRKSEFLELGTQPVKPFVIESKKPLIEEYEVFTKEEQKKAFQDYKKIQDRIIRLSRCRLNSKWIRK